MQKFNVKMKKKVAAAFSLMGKRDEGKGKDRRKADGSGEQIG